MNLETIEAVFDEIPSAELLAIAHNTQKAINKYSPEHSPSLVGIKGLASKTSLDFVTQADLLIQARLSRYFAESALAGSYILKAEEGMEESQPLLKQNPQGKEQQSAKECWQLIIDPLDGTNSFCCGEKTWGVMVGLCDSNGELCYSWNLVSTGEVFTSGAQQKTRALPDWHELIIQQKPICIDIYDYGSGAIDLIPSSLERASGGKFQQGQFLPRSCPAAVWAAWQVS